MRRFKVGCNFDVKLIDGIRELNDAHEDAKVVEFFGSLSSLNPVGSARPDFRLPDGDKDFLHEYVLRMKSAGIDMNYTLNVSMVDPRVLDGRMAEIRPFLSFLEHIGTRRVTVAHPLVAKIVQENSGLPIEISTISQLRDPWQLEEWVHRYPHVDKICMDVFANRDFRKLEAFCAKGLDLGVEVEVLVNEFCIMECLDRNQCYDIHSLNLSDKERRLFNNYPMGNCIAKRITQPVEWLRARFVLPQWIARYQELGVTSFKISGRTHPTDYILWVTEQYLNGYYGGNLLELWANVENIGKAQDEYKAPREAIRCERLPEGFLEWYEQYADTDEYAFLNGALEVART